MDEYSILITHLTKKVVNFDAESHEKALKQAENLYNQEKISLKDHNYEQIAFQKVNKDYKTWQKLTKNTKYSIINIEIKRKG